MYASKRGRPSEAVKTEGPGPRLPLSETKPKAELSREEGEGPEVWTRRDGPPEAHLKITLPPVVFVLLWGFPKPR